MRCEIKEVYVLKRLEAKVAIVTGAGTGVGRATAKLFAKEGAKVVATDIDEKSVQESVDLILKEGGEAIAIKQDVALEEDWKTVKEKTLERFEGIDILVNNAAILGKQLPVEEIDLETWKKVMDVNVAGVFLGVKTVADVMKKQKSGSIVNISSIVANRAVGDNANYTASKGAIRALNLQVGLELGQYGVRVNAINPGVIMTDMLAGLSEEELEEFSNLIALNRESGKIADPMDIAQAALFLASDEASYIHGVELPVDGGFASLLT